MLRTSEPARRDLGEILRFLGQRRLHNAWLIWPVYDALRRPQDWARVIICRRQRSVRRPGTVSGLHGVIPTSERNMTAAGGGCSACRGSRAEAAAGGPSPRLHRARAAKQMALQPAGAYCMGPKGEGAPSAPRVRSGPLRS